jgi:hypothetical protein
MSAGEHHVCMGPSMKNFVNLISRLFFAHPMDRRHSIIVTSTLLVFPFIFLLAEIPRTINSDNEISMAM